MLPCAALGAVHAEPVDPMPAHEDRGLSRELTNDRVEALLRVSGPDSGSVQTMVKLRLLGGALARPGRHRSAFCHRDAAFSLTTIGVLAPSPGNAADAVPAHAASVIAALASWSTGGQLPNFGGSADPARLARC